MLVDLVHPTLHVAERLLVRDIVEFGDDVVCVLASVEHVPRILN